MLFTSRSGQVNKGEHVLLLLLMPARYMMFR